MLHHKELATAGILVLLASPALAQKPTASSAEVESIDPETLETKTSAVPAIQESTLVGPTWHTPAPPTSHPWLTLIELGATIAGGITWYWVDRDRQVADWDYPGWESKLLFKKEIFIFDNNPFMVNYSWHTFAGGASHILGRANGLNVWASTGLGLAASIVWEYGIESRELISLNDLLMTNTTGIAVGEFFHRLGQYSHYRRNDSPGWQAVRWTFGLAHGVHGQLDPSLHVEPKIWPHFDFSYGLTTATIARHDGAVVQDQERLLHSLSFEGEFVALERYMQPGTRSGVFHQANFTRFHLKLTTGDGSATNAYGDTFLLGYRTESIPQKDIGAVGLAYNVGTSIGYLYHREGFGVWESRLGGLHVPGLATDGHVFGDSWKLRWRGRAHVDLMGVNSLSSQRWLDSYLDEDAGVVGKSIIKSDGYYYGWGASARANVELEFPIVTLGGNLFYGQYYSIEGFDRLRDELAYEIRGNDEFLDAEAWIRATVYKDFYAEVRYGDHRRDGQLAEFFANETMRDLTFKVGAALQ
ncbi:MAG: DUF3943 domain-containing protein [Kofleriaceae bacterium]